MSRKFFLALLFCLFLSVPHFMYAGGMDLTKVFNEEIKSDADYEPVGFCYKISSSTPDINMELLLGSCANSQILNETYYLPPDGPGGSEIPWDYYFFDNPDPDNSRRYYILFSPTNAKQRDFTWNLRLTKSCTLNFQRLYENPVINPGSLSLYKGGIKIGDLQGDNAAFALESGDYTIEFTPFEEVESSIGLSIKPGWNLLHLPIVPRGKETEEGWINFLELARFDLAGKTYVRAPGSVPAPGAAFWIYNSGADYEITLNGYVTYPHEWIELKKGWNLSGAAGATDVYIWQDGSYKNVESVDNNISGYWKYKE